MIYYFFLEKNKVSFEALGRRWLTFVTEFIPNAWAYAIGGFALSGYLTIAAVLVLGIYEGLKKRISRQWVVLFIATFMMFVILRYTRTPLFESFYVFTHPFIILLTGWALLKLFNIKKAIAILAFISLLAASLYTDVLEVSKPTSNINADRSSSQMSLLSEKFPQKKFAIYDYKFETSAYSQSLAVFLYDADKIDDNGMKVGFSNAGRFKHKAIVSDGSLALYDLSALSHEQLEKEKWVFVNPSAIYESVQDWYRK